MLAGKTSFDRIYICMEPREGGWTRLRCRTSWGRTEKDNTAEQDERCRERDDAAGLVLNHVLNHARKRPQKQCMKPQSIRNDSHRANDCSDLGCAKLYNAQSRQIDMRIGYTDGQR